MVRKERSQEEIRGTEIIVDFLDNPKGSTLISMGSTKVISTVIFEEDLPPWMDEEDEKGWLTARYGMLPGSGETRIRRETKGVRGRTKEIQRMIGRSLRCAIDLEKIGQRTAWVDCDVIQADGGTRTASITAAWVALKSACDKMVEEGNFDNDPIKKQVAAVSVGLVEGDILLDLCYEEDFAASVDMNVVMDHDHNYVEIQSAGEEGLFTREQHEEMLDLAESGIKDLFKVQKESLD